MGYLAGSIGYIALPVILVLIAARPTIATLKDMAWPADTERRLAAAAFWAPCCCRSWPGLPRHPDHLAVVDVGVEPLPVMLLSSRGVTWRPRDTSRVVLIAAVLPLIMLIVSPGIAIMTRRDGPPPAGVQSHLLAVEADRLWHETIPYPLRFVGGDEEIVLGVVAYAKDRPRALMAGLPDRAQTNCGAVA